MQDCYIVSVVNFVTKEHVATHFCSSMEDLKARARESAGENLLVMTHPELADRSSESSSASVYYELRMQMMIHQGRATA